MRKPGPPPDASSAEGLALFLLGWIAGKCRSDDCPVHVDHVEANSLSYISGGPSNNTIVTLIGDEGSYDTHFDVVTRSGVKLRLELEVLP